MNNYVFSGGNADHHVAHVPLFAKPPTGQFLIFVTTNNRTLYIGALPLQTVSMLYSHSSQPMFRGIFKQEIPFYERDCANIFHRQLTGCKCDGITHRFADSIKSQIVWGL